MLLRERKLVTLEQLQKYTWRVQKQKNWRGGYGYMIEVDELDGLISYGNTYREAKEGLMEAVHYWLQQRQLTSLPARESSQPSFIRIDTSMSEEEFQEINLLIQKW